MGAQQNFEELYYPNRWGRIVLTSAEEIVGDKGMAALLNMANLQKYINNYPPDNMKKEFTFTEVGKLQQAFWDMYGARGARVFAHRAGEQSFNDGLKSFGAVAKAAQASMQISSLEKRVSIGLGLFAKFFNTVSDQKVYVTEDESNWYWHIEVCPMCAGRTSDRPVCHLASGVLQAAFAWASGGQRIRVTPEQCIAMGANEGVVAMEKPPKEG